MRIVIINYEPIKRYLEKGSSIEQLEAYYNPHNVADQVCIIAFEDDDWQISENVCVKGYRSFKELRSKCLAYKPDVIRCYEALRPSSDYALLIALELGVPSYLSLHDMRVDYNHCIGYFTVITAYTESLANKAATLLGRDVELQLNGIDPNIMAPKNPTNIDNRVSGAKYKVLTIGRNDPVKNVDTAIEATRIASERYPGLTHVIAGEDTDKIEYDGLHLGLGNMAQDTLCEYLNWCDCFLQVQLVTDIGKAATEALMVGRPVIQTGNEEGNAVLHIDGNRGIIIPLDKAKDPEYVAEKLMQCLEKSWDNNGIREYALRVYSTEYLRELEAQRYKRLAGMNRQGLYSKKAYLASQMSFKKWDIKNRAYREAINSIRHTGRIIIDQFSKGDTSK